MSLQIKLLYCDLSSMQYHKEYNGKYLIVIQIEGKYYLKIDPQGEGARWRRTFGQEIYSPLLLAFSEQVWLYRWNLPLAWLLRLFMCSTCTNLFTQDGSNWANSHVPKFSAMDPTYSLPDNVALLTLQVPALLYHCCHNVLKSENIHNFYVMLTNWV